MKGFHQLDKVLRSPLLDVRVISGYLGVNLKIINKDVLRQLQRSKSCKKETNQWPTPLKIKQNKTGSKLMFLFCQELESRNRKIQEYLKCKNDPSPPSFCE